MLRPSTNPVTQSSSKSMPKIPALDVRAAELLDREPALAAFMAIPSVNEAIRRPGLKAAELILTVLRAYADRPALGWRSHEVVVDRDTGRQSLNLLPAFRTLT